MIWLLYGLIALGVVVALAPAFFGEPEGAQDDQELATYFAQIDALEADTDLEPAARDAAVVALKRQVLARQERTAPPVAAKTGGAVLLGVAAAGAALYAATGSPGLTRTPDTPPVAVSSDNAELAQLVEQLEARLATDRAEDPQGWQILARSLMTLERFDEALAAYDRVVALSPGDPGAQAERDSARAFVSARSRGPSAQDIADAQAMSAEDQAAMIQGMVDSASARLADAPDDPQTWVMLLRARRVLGQQESDAAQAELARLRATYAERPDVVERVLIEAGWPADAGR